MFAIPILSFLIFIPLLAVLVILTIKENDAYFGQNIKYVTILTNIIHLILIGYLWFEFDKINSLYQFVEKIPLIPGLNFNYYLGIDGISLIFITLSSVVMLIVLLFIDFPKEKVKLYAICFLLLLGASVGTFASLDMILFYMFYEISMFPVFFIIGIFGEGNKIYASLKFFLYTLAGSILMIVAMIVMISLAKTSSLPELTEFSFTPEFQKYLFIAMFIAFAVKSALFPFHTWLPDTYESAPMSMNIVLSGILMKYGIYGFLRFLVPMFPLATLKSINIIYVLSLITLFYCGLIALKQTNIKRLFAYFSISHVALIIAGIFSVTAQGIEGAIFQSIGHSIFNAGIFLGIVLLQKRFRSDLVADFKGLANVMPRFCVMFFIFMLAAMSFPITSTFIGEILILLGIFQNNRLYAVMFTFSILLNSVIVISFMKTVIFSKVSLYTKSFKEVNLIEFTSLSLVAILVLAIGIYPDIFLDMIHTSVSNILERFRIVSI
ncbi:NADH-quinone oxidoreductase subunit M [Candidatus Hepatincolaceae symbiont of Richtersius coronifer]